MNLFLCHTPLHLLISMMVAYRKNDPQNTIFVVVEDSRGLHSLAVQLLRDGMGRLVMLPGSATAEGRLQRTLIMRSNARFLCREFGQVVRSVYLFHDLRPEPQSLLNMKRFKKISADFIMLEDGIALYRPGGVIPWSLLGVLKHKFAAGPHWMKFDELGLHPSISRICCFYPDLLRENLRPLPVDTLPKDRVFIEDVRLQMPLEFYGKKITLIAVPYADSVSSKFMRNFLDPIVEYCRKNETSPIFKIHPRDKNGAEILTDFWGDPLFMPQHLPAEMILFSGLNIHSIIGSRTSTLHIAKFLFPEICVFHYDEMLDEDGRVWIEFLDHVGVSLIYNHSELLPA
ncbi:hypothetical protein SAMN05421547_101561 [Delftia lacustris]|uniref:CDP-Glycerol:Poly(Glycerophosphate) glycerophosphotransferase n=2 Tax=Delftia lacustris TaxID=558537 RepID=A0A1H3F9E9_9BURK|nr:hypothetical protein SAMN05421547_101561 [Delftia lacustris]